MLNRQRNKYDNLIGLVGGVACLGFSEVDRNWGVFWLLVGAALILWSVTSFFFAGSRRL